MEKPEEYQCCFCGDRIEKIKPDPCSLGIIANYLSSPNQHHSQGMFCHLRCFEDRLHPSIPRYLTELFDDE